MVDDGSESGSNKSSEYYRSSVNDESLNNMFWHDLDNEDNIGEVLVVDDEPMNMFVFSQLLKPLNISFNGAVTGQKALELVHERVSMAKETGLPMFRLILLDYSLGDDFDGPAVAQRIR